MLMRTVLLLSMTQALQFTVVSLRAFAEILSDEVQIGRAAVMTGGLVATVTLLMLTAIGLVAGGNVSCADATQPLCHTDSTTDSQAGWKRTTA